MAKKAKPSRNNVESTLRLHRTLRRELNLLTAALKSIDKRLHLVEANLAALMVPKVEPTDDGVRITLADDGA